MGYLTGDDAQIVAQVCAPIYDAWVDNLRALDPRLSVRRHVPGSGDTPATGWRDVDILYTSFATPLPAPEEAPRLRWVQFYSAGIEQVLGHPLAGSGVVFTTTSGIHATPIAEYVLAMILSWYKKLPQMREWQHAGQWPSAAERSRRFTQSELRGAALGVVGYGSVGREVARLARAFGMRVVATSHGADHRDHGYQLGGVGDPEGVLPERYVPLEALNDLLSECDVVLIALPSTPATRGLFGADAFQAMRPSALLINIARGDICDEAALVAAL